MLSSAAGLMEIRAQAERDSGIGLKLFGFIAESVFTFIPESCSRSSRNSVRNHPGIAFTFPRIPHLDANDCHGTLTADLHRYIYHVNPP